MGIETHNISLIECGVSPPLLWWCRVKETKRDSIFYEWPLVLIHLFQLISTQLKKRVIRAHRQRSQVLTKIIRRMITIEKSLQTTCLRIESVRKPHIRSPLTQSFLFPIIQFLHLPKE